MRPRFTNKYIKWRGNTTLISGRVPVPIAEQMQAKVGTEGLPNLSAVLQDACAYWAMGEEEDA